MSQFDYAQRDQNSTRSVIILMVSLGVTLLCIMLAVTLLGHRI